MNLLKTMELKIKRGLYVYFGCTKNLGCFFGKHAHVHSGFQGIRYCVCGHTKFPEETK